MCGRIWLLSDKQVVVWREHRTVLYGDRFSYGDTELVECSMLGRRGDGGLSGERMREDWKGLSIQVVRRLMTIGDNNNLKGNCFL